MQFVEKLDNKGLAEMGGACSLSAGILPCCGIVGADRTILVSTAGGSWLSVSCRLDTERHFHSGQCTLAYRIFLLLLFVAYGSAVIPVLAI